MGSGDEQETFTVYKDLLEQGSSFFNQIISDVHREWTVLKIELLDQGRATFRYVYSLCFGEISVTRLPELDNFEEMMRNEHNNLVDLYILADISKDISTRDKVIATMVDSSYKIRVDGF